MMGTITGPLAGLERGRAAVGRYNMLGSLLTFFLVGLITLIVAGVVLSVVGAALGLASFLLFKVAPFLLVGWLVLKVIEKTRGGGKLSDADRKWLDG